MTTAIIGGSGFYHFDAIEHTDTPRVMTAFGEPSAPIVRGRIGDAHVLFLARHGVEHRLPPDRVNYRANVAALKQLGAERIVGVTAVGGIAKAAAPGTIVIPDQIIDYTYGRAHTFFDDAERQPEHIDFTEPYTPELRRTLIEAASAAGICVIDGGVYGATQGPRLETAAEIDRMANDGCTIVGMTGMPEAALARELALEYANVSMVVNPAAGRGAGPISVTSIERELKNAMADARALIAMMLNLSKWPSH